MKSSIFSPSCSISVLAILHNFKTVCDSTGIHERATMWFFPHLIKSPTTAALSYQNSAVENKKLTEKEQGQPTVKLSAIYSKPTQVMRL